MYQKKCRRLLPNSCLIISIQSRSWRKNRVLFGSFLSDNDPQIKTKKIVGEKNEYKNFANT